MLRTIFSRGPVRRPTSIFAVLCIGAAFSTFAYAGDHLVTQKDKAFSVKAIDIKVGDTLTFRNDDSVAHNIFSLSDPMTFDLGAYGPGQTRQVAFPTAGTFEIECAIHPDMKLQVHVSK
jgi:plastocyanin